MPVMKSKSQRQSPYPHYPDMGPFASLFFVVSCFFLLTSTLQVPPRGLVRLEATPYLTGSECFNIPDHTQIHVCLTSKGLLSFASSNSATQWAILEEVCKKYGVSLSASLAALPFVAVKLERLSAIPSYSRSTKNRLENTVADALTTTQLLDCVAASRRLSPQVTGRPTIIYLSIDSQTNARLVMKLLHLLEQKGINRLQLLTHHN